MSEQAKHTPGPWLIMRNTVYALDATGTTNRFSTKPEGGWLHNCGEYTPDTELAANASLIAAAPELLRELQELVTAVRFADPPKLFNGVECHEARVPVAFIQGAEAAIAKARGETA